jgi:membrane protein
MFLAHTGAPWRERLAQTLQTLQHWPWLDTLRTLRARFREDRLGLTASSLTFTTLIAIVPLVTVMFAVFSALPLFASFRSALEAYFLQALVPDSIAQPVLSALGGYAAKARKLGGVGAIVLVFTALAMMLTIDRALNAIWRVPRARPIAQRVLVYWAAITLGPLVLGISLSLTTWVLAAGRGAVNDGPGVLEALFTALEFGLLAVAMAGLFHYVPNTHVRWRHALAGGVFVAIGFEFAKRLLAWWVGAMPGYSAVYGPIATLPIFMLWIYIGWVVVLLGAVVAAYAPSLQMRVVRQPNAPGSRFALALSVLRELDSARRTGPRGLPAGDIAAALRTDPLQIEPILDTLVRLDWVARLDEEGAQRHVLLADPSHTPAAPLIDQLLLEPKAATRALRERAGFAQMTLAELL